MSIVFLSLLGVCSFLAVLTSYSNRSLPVEETNDVLSAADKARLLEALHLKAALGEQVWPGWGQADHPVIVWNQAYEFLANTQDPAPAGWSIVEEDDLNGERYFRRPSDDPQNFAVRLGDTWAASMATKQTTDSFLVGVFRDNLPGPLKQVFPYRLLLQPSETQIGGLLHESFHVYQYQMAPARMAEAESIHRLGEEYEGAAATFRSDWKKESVLLAEALQAGTQAERLKLVRKFLEAREARRESFALDDRLVNYERWLEWEEGTAKYIELAILKQAGNTPEYRALPGMEADPDFQHYQKIDRRWSQEMFQLRYPMSSGETRFYMTGLAQAFLLDELMPGWQEQYWAEDVFLEDLLELAICECSAQ